MDGEHFDVLTQTLTAAGSRRGVLGALASLPILGGLFTLVDHDETDARGRRKRRKKRHKHGKGRNTRKHKQTCNPPARTTTCAGRCGQVRNNCKKTVDCGSCACTPQCQECFTCQGAAGVPGACVPEEAGTPCGAATFCSGGTLFPQGSCDGDGTCFSSLEEPCEPYLCDGDACATTCGSTADCAAGYFCDGDQCLAQGEPGDFCDTGEGCLSGFCATGVCCTTACDSGCDVCDASGDGTCTTLSCPSGQACVSNGTCALLCSDSPTDTCMPIGGGCACRSATSGQAVCQRISYSDCRCVADCGLCEVGEVCQGSGTGQCPTTPKCCPACGV